MKTCFKLIIFSLFFYILNSINGENCSRSKCPKSVNTSAFSTNFSVEYPFRLKGQQSKSCSRSGSGFELYCDEALGTLIQLPNDVVLRVDDISYLHRYITVSDPYKCLPRILMSLNLTDTPFKVGDTENFWLYNCSGDAYLSRYDRIDCLSGPNYTVISSWYDISGFGSLECSFVMILRAPKYRYSSSNEYNLSSISTIDLTWTGKSTPSPPKTFFNRSYSTTPALLPALIGAVFATGLTLFCCCECCRCCLARASSTTPITNTNATIRHLSTTPVVVVAGGLDQVTIDSYPVVVLGENDTLKSDDDICAICLSDYEPEDMLKTLPRCLHRFHKDCVDQWLRSKGVCPVCRASPLTS